MKGRFYKQAFLGRTSCAGGNFGTTRQTVRSHSPADDVHHMSITRPLQVEYCQNEPTVARPRTDKRHRLPCPTKATPTSADSTIRTFGNTDGKGGEGGGVQKGCATSHSTCCLIVTQKAQKQMSTPWWERLNTQHVVGLQQALQAKCFLRHAWSTSANTIHLRGDSDARQPSTVCRVPCTVCRTSTSTSSFCAPAARHKFSIMLDSAIISQ